MNAVESTEGVRAHRMYVLTIAGCVYGRPTHRLNRALHAAHQAARLWRCDVHVECVEGTQWRHIETVSWRNTKGR